MGQAGVGPFWLFPEPSIKSVGGVCPRALGCLSGLFQASEGPKAGSHLLSQGGLLCGWAADPDSLPLLAEPLHEWLNDLG